MVITQGNENQIIDVEDCEDLKLSAKTSTTLQNSSSSEELLNIHKPEESNKLTSPALTKSTPSAKHSDSNLKHSENSNPVPGFWESIRRANDSDNDEPYEEIDPDEIMKADDKRTEVVERQIQPVKTLVNLLTQKSLSHQPPQNSLIPSTLAGLLQQKNVNAPNEKTIIAYGKPVPKSPPSNKPITWSYKNKNLEYDQSNKQYKKKPTARKSTTYVYVAKNLGKPALVTKQVYEGDAANPGEQKASQLKYFSISNRPSDKDTVKVDYRKDLIQIGNALKKKTPSSPVLVRVKPPAGSTIVNPRGSTFVNPPRSSMLNPEGSSWINPTGSFVLNPGTKRTIQDYLIHSDAAKKIKLEDSPDVDSGPTSPTVSPAKSDVSENCSVILSRDPSVEDLVKREVLTRSVKRQRSDSLSDHREIEKKPRTEDRNDDFTERKDDIRDDTKTVESIAKTKSKLPTCGFCGKEFHLHNSLKRHIAALHFGETKDGKGMEAMLPSNSSTTVYDKNKFRRCNKCRKMFSNRHSLIRHIRNIHRVGEAGNETKKVDEVKANTFVSPRRKTEVAAVPFLRDRRRSASVDSRTISEMGSSSHMSSDEDDTTCGFCAKEFSSSRSLKRHIRTVHKDKQTDAQTKNTDSKVQHSVSSTASSKSLSQTPRYQCPICNVIYGSRSTCYRHVRHAHRSGRGILVIRGKPSNQFTPNPASDTFCHICQQSYNHAYTFRRHVRKVHKFLDGILPPPKSEDKSEEAEGPSEVDRSCHKCNRVYSTMNNLRQHIKNIHKIPSGEFPVKMKVTPKKDINPTTGESIWYGKTANVCYCRKCGQQYSNQANLRRHQQNHYGRVYGNLKLGEESIDEKKKKRAAETLNEKKIKPAEEGLNAKKIKRTEESLSEKKKKHSKSTPKPDVPCYICKCGEKYVSFMRLMRHISLDHKKKKIIKEEFSDGDDSIAETDKESNDGSEASSEEEMELKSEESPTEGEEEIDGDDSPTSEDEESEMLPCEMCNEEFSSDSKLKRHYRDLHKVTKEIYGVNQPKIPKLEGTTCIECGKEYSSLANMKRHYAVAHKPGKVNDIKEPLHQKRFKCKRCGLKFSSLEQYRRHSEEVHKVKVSHPTQAENKDKLSCYKCGSQYLFYGNLLHHLQKAHSVKFKDPSTLKHFLEKRQKTIKKEDKSRENAEESDSSAAASDSIACYKCGKSYSAYSKLYHHVKTVHKKAFMNAEHLRKFTIRRNQSIAEKSEETIQEKDVTNQENKAALQCFKCDRKYSLYRNLLTHVRKIHGMKFRDAHSLKVSMGKRKANQKEALNKAEETKLTTPAKETGDQKFKCQKCGRLYAQEGNLLRHYQLIHNMQPLQISQTVTETVCENDDCHTCSKYTGRLRELRRHLHTDHSCRLPGWKDKDNKAQIRFLCMKIKEVESMNETDELCGTCLRGRELKRSVFRHWQKIHLNQEKTVATSSKPKSSPKKPLLVKIPSKPTYKAASPQKAHESNPVVSQSDDSQASQEMEFYCVACGEGFWRADSLLRHQNKILPEKSLKCMQCAAGFRTCQALSMHSANGCNTPAEESDEDERQRYKCEVCKESFAQLQSLVNHHKDQHNKNSIYNCRFCSGTFRTLSYLRHHIKKSHANEADSVDENNSIGTPSENAEDHSLEEEVRPTENLWPNLASAGIKMEPGDSEAFTILRNELEYHEPGTNIKAEPQDYPQEASAEYNTGEMDYNTGETDASSDPNAPSSFVKTVDGRYQCNNCGSCFQYLKSLIQHQRIQHKSMRHKCSKCPASFHTRIYLLYHCKSQHGITDPETQRPVGLSSQLKSSSASKPSASGKDDSLTMTSPYRYNCPMCPTGFRTFFYLSYHLEQFHGINDLDDQAYEGAMRNSQTIEGGSQKIQTGPNKRMSTGEKLGTFRNGRHYCNTCGSSFEGQKSLKDHYRKQHELSGNEFKCPKCHANFRTRRYMQMHVNSQHGLLKPGQKLGTIKNGRHSCTICGSLFGLYNSLAAHFHKQHRHDSKWKCAVCAAKFQTRDYMINHEKVRHGTVNGKKIGTKEADKESPSPCHHCGARFVKLRNLKSHVADQHVIINFRCKDCSAGFTTNHAFTQHCKRRHGQTQKESQHDGATEKRSPKTYKRTVPIDPNADFFKREDGRFECKICGSHFKHRKNVPYHLKEAHSSKKVTCSHCPAYFSRAKFLVYHQRVRHNIEAPRRKSDAESQKKVETVVREKVKPKSNYHMCGLCKSNFKSLSEIREHIKSDHQFLPTKFSCDHCGEGFMQHFFYKAHMKHHNVFLEKQVAEKPVLEGSSGFKCSMCHIYCAGMTYLLQHRSHQHRCIRQVCLLCHAGFDRRGQLEQHLKRIHKLVEMHTGEYSLNLASYRPIGAPTKTNEGATSLLGDGAYQNGDGLDLDPTGLDLDPTNQNGNDDLDLDPAETSTLDTSQEETGSRYLQDPLDIEISLEDSDHVRSESDQQTETMSIAKPPSIPAEISAHVSRETETTINVNNPTPIVEEPATTDETESSPMMLKISATMSLQSGVETAMSLQSGVETARNPPELAKIADSAEKLITLKMGASEEIVELPNTKPVPEFIDLTELSDVEIETEITPKVIEQPMVKEEVDSDIELLEDEHLTPNSLGGVSLTMLTHQLTRIASTANQNTAQNTARNNGQEGESNQ